MDALLQQHNVHNWTEVKALLPKLMPTVVSSSVTKPVPTSFTVHHVLQSLLSAVKHLQCLTTALDDDNRGRLQSVLNTLCSEAARVTATSV